MSMAAETKAAHDKWINAITEVISSCSNRPSDDKTEEEKSSNVLVILPDGSALDVKIGKI